MCRIATGRAALQQVVPRCNRSCGVTTGRAVLQQVVQHCNRLCSVATGRAALQQVVLRCNRSSRVATGRAALQQAVLRCNRSCCVATGRGVLQLALPQRACATGRWCAASQCACRRPHNPNASGRTIPGRHPPRRVGPRLRGARRAPPPWRTSCGCTIHVAPCCSMLHHHVAPCCITLPTSATSAAAADSIVPAACSRRGGRR